MRYTSWDRTDKDRLRLLVDAGPAELGQFGTDQAQVGSDLWKLDSQKASATTESGRVFRIDGGITRNAELRGDLDGRGIVFRNERRSDWVILDTDGEKIGQFSGANSGVREAIVEFDGAAQVSPEEAAAVSWLARLILEDRLEKKSTGIIATLIVATVVAVVAFLV